MALRGAPRLVKLEVLGLVCKVYGFQETLNLNPQPSTPNPKPAQDAHRRTRRKAEGSWWEVLLQRLQRRANRRLGFLVEV